MTDSISFEQH